MSVRCSVPGAFALHLPPEMSTDLLKNLDPLGRGSFFAMLHSKNRRSDEQNGGAVFAALQPRAGII
jgi:hypothetical protein